MTNVVGTYKKETFFGRSMVVDYRGNVISMMNDQPGYQVTPIYLLALREWRKSFRILDYLEAEAKVQEEYETELEKDRNS